MNDMEVGKIIEQASNEQPGDLSTTIQLCEMYLTTTDQQRELIRCYFANKQAFQTVFSDEWYSTMIDKLRETKDPRWLKHLLVYWSIEGARYDFRDTLQGLYHLWNEVRGVGIDPLPYFEQAAQISSESTAKLLLGYGNKSYFEKTS